MPIAARRDTIGPRVTGPALFWLAHSCLYDEATGKCGQRSWLIFEWFGIFAPVCNSVQQTAERWPAEDGCGSIYKSRSQGGAVIGAGHNHHPLARLREEQQVGLIADILAPLIRTRSRPDPLIAAPSPSGPPFWGVSMVVTISRSSSRLSSPLYAWEIAIKSLATSVGVDYRPPAANSGTTRQPPGNSAPFALWPVASRLTSAGEGG